MSIRYSIIIPTAFDKCESLLKPCINSIKEYTDFTETEIIVVANGCTDDSYEWSRDQGCSVIEFRDAIGYTRAINEGARIAQGEFLIPFNNDNVLLPQAKGDWMRMLHFPFGDSLVAATGPWKNWCPYAERDFLLFFCVMIRRSVFDQLGGLDEIFSPGYGEDTDFCCRAVDSGYLIRQVPDEEPLKFYAENRAVAKFPIFHDGNRTFKNWPGGEELLAHNRKILKIRYASNIGRALEIDGFMASDELRWIAGAAKKAKVAIELGSWHGRSSRAFADNLPLDGRLICVDTWNGSATETETNHASAKMMDGDHAYDEFIRNMWDHVESGKVLPLRMHSLHAAKFLLDQGVKADLIFIDGGHEYKEVLEDIKAFLPLLKEGGVISGHDFKQGLMPSVTPAVLDVFGKNVGQPWLTTIWYSDYRPELCEIKPGIFDCFIFNNEVDILERRLSRLHEVVDRFVIIEATMTHSGKKKDLCFQNNLERFEKYLHKITYYVLDDYPLVPVNATVSDRSWAIERHQRDTILKVLDGCKENDIIIISDADEIPSAEAIKGYNGTNDIRCFEMDLFYYNLQTKGKHKWCAAKILPYRLLKQLSPCGARYAQASPIADGGEHLSYFGGVQAIIEKIENTAHQEYNTEYFKDPERITACILAGCDIFERPDVKFELCE